MSDHVHDWRPDPEAPGGPFSRREWLVRRVCACGARARVRQGVVVPLKTQRSEPAEPTVQLPDDVGINGDGNGWRERHGGAE